MQEFPKWVKCEATGIKVLCQNHEEAMKVNPPASSVEPEPDKTEGRRRKKAH
jgi:hypothetical protein